MIRGRREREEVRKVRKEKGIRVRMAKGREREEWLRVGNREGKREGSGVGVLARAWGHSPILWA